MQLTVDGTTYDFDIASLSNVEAMEIERVTGSSFKSWGAALQDGSTLALTALVWIVRRRGEPDLRFDGVSFPLGSIELDATDAEVAMGRPTEATTP